MSKVIPPLPLLYVPGSHILLIAQNPGFPKNTTEINEYNDPEIQSFDYLETYEKWFKRCHAYRALGRYFGVDWLDSGLYSYTNAVKCCTISNTSPSYDVVLNCKPHTRSIIDELNPTAIILIGNSAANQFGFVQKWNKIVRSVATGRYIVKIKHFAAHLAAGELDAIREVVEEVKSVVVEGDLV